MNGRKSLLISLQFLAFFDPLKVNNRAVKVPRNYLFPRYLSRYLYIDIDMILLKLKQF